MSISAALTQPNARKFTLQSTSGKELPSHEKKNPKNHQRDCSEVLVKMQKQFLFHIRRQTHSGDPTSSAHFGESEGEDVDDGGEPVEAFLVDEGGGDVAGDAGLFVVAGDFAQEWLLKLGGEDVEAVVEKALDEGIFRVGGEFDVFEIVHQLEGELIDALGEFVGDVREVLARTLMLGEEEGGFVFGKLAKAHEDLLDDLRFMLNEELIAESQA